MSGPKTLASELQSAAPAAPDPAERAWRVAVVIPTVGRAATTRRAVDRLARQSRAPDRILVVGASPEDLAGLDGAAVRTEAHIAPRGLCLQRNYALALVEKDVDLVVYFDDDFLPADDFLEAAERLFREQPDVVGACGRVFADGAQGPGLSFEQAEQLLAEGAPPRPDLPWLRERIGLYGCNMVYRARAIEGMRFDENLPLYGWQEDFDFSHRARQHGRLVGCAGLLGVHMGEKSGRSSGKRLGYSQVANPIYLLRKRSMPRHRVLELVRDNVAANLLRCLVPEPHIDRRGRLLGNLLAAADLARGRLDPRRVLELR